MKYNLKEAREHYGLTKAQMAGLVGLKELFYSKYEKKGEFPSKYIYILWTKLDGFPVPDDFFYYTSFTMQVNMKYHRLSQKQVAELFDIANQSTISGYLSQNIPMYEAKEYFEKFDPLIIPMTMPANGGLQEIKDLVPKGNFILVDKRRAIRHEKDDLKEPAKTGWHEAAEGA